MDQIGHLVIIASQALKTQKSLHISIVSPEHSILAYIKYGSEVSESNLDL